MRFDVCIEEIIPETAETINQIDLSDVTLDELKTLTQIVDRHGRLIIHCVPIIEE